MPRTETDPSDLQHCPTCDEEYVAGVAACVECGGPLTPGPLARLAGAPRPTAVADTPSATLDRLLAELPGKEADRAVRALILEGITSRVECRGQEKIYTPERPPAEPFAVSLPVSVYVAAAEYDAAREILESFATDDLIGEQWGTEAEVPEPPGAGPDADHAVGSAADPIEPEGTSLRTALLAVIIVVVLLVLFGR